MLGEGRGAAKQERRNKCNRSHRSHYVSFPCWLLRVSAGIYEIVWLNETRKRLKKMVCERSFPEAAQPAD
jgi:hypothetical protein